MLIMLFIYKYNVYISIDFSYNNIALILIYIKNKIYSRTHYDYNKLYNSKSLN